MPLPKETGEGQPNRVDLFVVGVDLSFNEFGQLNTYDTGQPGSPREWTTTQAVYLFGWTEGTDYKGMPLLDPFPIIKGIGKRNAAKFNQLLTELLPAEFAKINGVSVDGLRFPLLQKSAELVTPRLRHEMGYALLLEAKNRAQQRTPQKFRQAMTNTGNLFLRSVGVDWWSKKKDKAAIEVAYNEQFRGLWGDLPPLFDPQRSGGIHTEFEMVLRQLDLMRQARTIQATADFEEIAELGHGFTYIVKHVAAKTELVFGPRWASTRSTPVGASWVKMEIPVAAENPAFLRQGR